MPNTPRTSVASGSSAVSTTDRDRKFKRDRAARPSDPHRLAHQRQGVAAVAVLQRDVAEHDVGDAVGDGERAAVGHLDRPQAVDATVSGHGLAAALEEAGVEVARVDRAEAAGELARHPPDARADLDERPPPVGAAPRLSPNTSR